MDGEQSKIKDLNRGWEEILKTGLRETHTHKRTTTNETTLIHINQSVDVYKRQHMENPVLAAPEYKLYAGADFTQGRWGLSTGIQYVKGLHTLSLIHI